MERQTGGPRSNPGSDVPPQALRFLKHLARSFHRSLQDVSHAILNRPSRTVLPRLRNSNCRLWRSVPGRRVGGPGSPQTATMITMRSCSQKRNTPLLSADRPRALHRYPPHLLEESDILGTQFAASGNLEPELGEGTGRCGRPRKGRRPHRKLGTRKAVTPIRIPGICDGNAGTTVVSGHGAGRVVWLRLGMARNRNTTRPL